MEILLHKSKIIMDLKEKIDHGNREALQELWDKIREDGAPIIEGIDGDEENSLVTFIYKGSYETKNVLLFLPFEPENYLDYNYDEYRFERLLDTDVWYKTHRIRNDIRFHYFFFFTDSLDYDWDKMTKEWIDDGLNKNQLIFKTDEGKDYILTYVTMPKADKHVWVKERINIYKGNIDLNEFKSDILNNKRRIWIYTPAQYSKSNEPYGFLVLNDGQEYLDILSAKEVLDNLINEKEIPPIIVAFIESIGDRMTELMCSDNYASFVSEEVIPWLRKNYNITTESKKCIIGGLSLGGLTASFIGFKYPNIFGNVLSQSGSYWYKREDIDNLEKRNWMAKQYKNNEKLNIKFYLNIGILEGKRPISMNQEMRDTLRTKGYDLYYEEFKSGHDYLCWGETLAKGLILLIGYK